MFSCLVPITAQPLHGNMLGGTGVFIHACDGIRSEDSVDCIFGTKIVKGKILNTTLAVCVSPTMQKSGYVPLEVVLDSQRFVKTQFLSCK